MIDESDETTSWPISSRPAEEDFFMAQIMCWFRLPRHRLCQPLSVCMCYNTVQSESDYPSTFGLKTFVHLHRIESSNSSICAPRPERTQKTQEHWHTSFDSNSNSFRGIRMPSFTHIVFHVASSRRQLYYHTKFTVSSKSFIWLPTLHTFSFFSSLSPPHSCCFSIDLLSLQEPRIFHSS